MRFAHLADCHIGGWREEELKELGMQSFELALERCLQERVDFILIAGDLFNTALPSIDLLKRTTIALKKAQDAQIPVYVVPGSHDFSPSGKTMLDVLEEAGLAVNVVKFEDGKLQFTEGPDGVKITGLGGKRGGLEIKDYLTLEKWHLEREEGFKIFMFHTTLSEFKPVGMENVEGAPLASLPKNFSYYAGGHVHFRFQRRDGKSLFTYPGPTFPNNFKELEELRCGSFYLVDERLNAELVMLPLKDVLAVKVDAEGKTSEEVEQAIRAALPADVEGKIVLLRVEGTLRSGKPSDIPFKEIAEKLNTPYCFLRNTTKLRSTAFEGSEVSAGQNVEEMEQRIVEAHMKQILIEGLTKERGEALTKSLMLALDKEKLEGERVADFEARLLGEAMKVLKLKGYP